jgi:hypothetical protein
MIDARDNGHTAYLLALVRDDRIVGFGIFSEENPTLAGPGTWLMLAASKRKHYHEAHSDVRMLGPNAGCHMGRACCEALDKLAANPDLRGVEVDHGTEAP